MSIDYTQLLNTALKEYDSFSLVWRDDMEFNESAKKLEEQLAPYLIEEKHTDVWPGTQLEYPFATVRIYQVNEKTIKTLQSVNSVFEWLSPNYPEDLAFYKNGVNKFASVAHEQMAWYV